MHRYLDEKLSTYIEKVVLLDSVSPSGHAEEAVAVSSMSMLFIFVGLTSWRMSRPPSSVNLCSECLPLAGVWPSALRKTADSVRRIESELLFDLGLSSSSRSMIYDKSGQLNLEAISKQKQRYQRNASYLIGWQYD